MTKVTFALALGFVVRIVNVLFPGEDGIPSSNPLLESVSLFGTGVVVALLQTVLEELPVTLN